MQKFIARESACPLHSLSPLPAFITISLAHILYLLFFHCAAPDYGVEEDLAHFYFSQLVFGLVSIPPSTLYLPPLHLPLISILSHLPHLQEYIHSQGVAHRDIKPENLLLDHAGKYQKGLDSLSCLLLTSIFIRFDLQRKSQTS